VLNINTATADELDSIPLIKGHGYEIVRYREERGGFAPLRQLDEVPGLSGKTDGIDKYIEVSSSLTL
jgi:competence ComEA-like helix-hairpin-helix protein